MPPRLRAGSRGARRRTGLPGDAPHQQRSRRWEPLRLCTRLRVEGVIPAPSLCCDPDSRSWVPRCASPGVPRAPACSQQRLEGSAHTLARVPGHREHHGRCAGHAPRRRPSAGTGNAHVPTSPHRRPQALDASLANDKIEALCQPLGCAHRGLSQWRKRYEATNPTWGQERSTRPTHSPTHTPAHVAQASVSRDETLRHNGTGGRITAIIRALPPARDRACAFPTHH